MARSVTVRPFRRLSQAELDSFLEKAADIYRGDAGRHTLEEVLEHRDEELFSRGVALAPECNRSIVDASIQWLQHLRETGTFHQLIAVACSVHHSRQVRSFYAERGLQIREIHSNTPRRKTIWNFR